MNDFINKVRSLIPTLVNKVRVGLENMPKPIKWIILGYIFLVALVLLIYLGCWVYLFVVGKAALPELLAFSRVLIDNSMITFITFILGLLIDTNKDGIPDALEGADKDANAVHAEQTKNVSNE